MRAETRQFQKRLAQVSSPDEALRALLSAVAEYGYLYAAYAFVAVYEPPHRTTECRLLDNFPPEWTQTGSDEFFGPLTNIAEHCLRFRRPLPFAELTAAFKDGGEHDRASGLASTAGAANGVAIPLRDGFPLSRGGLALIAPADLSAEDYELERRRHMAPLFELAEAFHTGLHRPGLVAEKCRLTPRERDCLAGAMQGLRVKQIAFQLGTNEKTVEKQLASARSRLSAGNIVQAAVKAMVLGLIGPGRARKPDRQD